MVSNVRHTLDVQFGMVDVFQAPTIAGLAALLYPRAAQESNGELVEMLKEIAGLSDEEARRRFDRELQTHEAAAA